MNQLQARNQAVSGPKNVINVGIDAGCNWTKAYFGNGVYASIRSTVSTRPSVTANLGFGPESDEIVLRVGDSIYAVGEHVEEPLDTRYEGYYTSEHNLCLAIAQLLRTQPDLSKSTVNAVFGMPINVFYNNDGTPNTKLVEARSRAWRVPVGVVRGPQGKGMAMPKESVFGELHGVSEGVGAYLDYHLSEDGEYVNGIDGLRCVVDVGGNTTDIGLFEDGRVLFGGNSNSFECGALHLYERVAGRAAQLMGLRKMPPLARIERAIREDGCWFQIGAMRENLRDIVAEERRALVNEVVPRIKKILTRRLDEVDTVIYAGGGAKLLESELKESGIGNARIVVMDDPQYANARGYYKYGQLILASQKAE